MKIDALKPTRRTCLLAAFACAMATSAAAQDTRAELVAQEQAAKAQVPTTPAFEAPGFFERTFSWAEAKFDPSTGVKDGFYPELGGMIPGAGWMSLGPGYRHQLFGNRAVIDTSLGVSWRRYSMMQTKIEWPRLAADRLSLGAQVKYQDFTQINYFGIGDDSSKDTRTNYRLKDLDIMGFGTVHPRPWLSIGGRAGLIRSMSVDRGASALYPSIGDVFTDGTAPGLAEQPRFLHSNVFVEVDSRDVPGYPRSGGRYKVSLVNYHDLDRSRYSFRRVEADAAQYIPLFHENWVLALRGRVALSQTADGQEVPFYLLPTLGGQSSLRGYLDYRFRDRDVALFSAEYRWPIFRALDGALFYDAGTVAPSARDLWRARLNSDYGVGLRVHSTNASIVRLDVGRSHEGMRALLTFSAPLGVPGKAVTPYVP